MGPPPPIPPALWPAAASIRRLARRPDISASKGRVLRMRTRAGDCWVAGPPEQMTKLGRSVSASADEQEVNDVDSGEAPIAGLPFHELSDLQSQLSRRGQRAPRYRRHG